MPEKSPRTSHCSWWTTGTHELSNIGIPTFGRSALPSPLLARWLGGNQACWLACAWGQGIESNASVRYIIYLDWWSMWWCNCGEGGFGFCILRSFGGACPWLPSTQAHAFIALGATKCTWPLPSSYWYLYATQFFFNLKKIEAIFSTNFVGFWFRNIYWGGNSVTCLMYVGCWFIPI